MKNRWLDVATTLYAFVVVAITFAGWGRSGQRVRNSYELVDIAGSADVVPESVDRFTGLWFLAPMTAALVFFCCCFALRRVAGAILASLGVSVATFAYLVDRSPLIATSASRWAVLLGTGAVLWGVVLLVRPRRIGTAPR